MWILGRRKTPAELLRENKRMIDKAIRELDRERTGLQNQEKKLVVEIKKAAKEGHMDVANALAKSIVRNRNAVTKLYNLKAQLQAVSLRLAELKSTQAMADAMRGTTKAMAAMNRRLNLPSLNKIMMEFMRQNEKMEMTSDMMGDAIDGVFEGEGEEEETDQLVSQVLDEIGVTAKADMVKVPGQRVAGQMMSEEAPAAVGIASTSAGGPPSRKGPGSVPTSAAAVALPPGGAADDIPDEELEARLAKLRGP